jgi:chitin disaccharide deacetylase
MLYINADDWGRSRAETNSIRECIEHGAVGSTSAMVFMEDSERAGDVAGEIRATIGFHVNFTEAFTSRDIPRGIAERQAQIAGFLKRSKYALVCYNPFLNEAFRYVFNTQLDEFRRIYGREPSHFDGHQHMHLCTNVLLGRIIPAGVKVRRSFSFVPGQKSLLNRTYRRWVDQRLAKDYQLAHKFFSLDQSLRWKQLDRVLEISNIQDVELMTHPIVKSEYDFLLSPQFDKVVQSVRVANSSLHR